MDPAGIKLEPDDLIASEFPLPYVFAGTPPLPGATEGIEGDPDAPGYLIGDWFSPKPSRPLHSTRCIATNRGDGMRCRNWSVIGFQRCAKHSGYHKLANLQEYRERVIERARLDLLKGAPYAVERLVELARDRDINPAVALKASTEILDRVGVRGGTELTVSADPEALSAADTIRARLDRLAAITATATTTAAESEILDAELVDEEVPDGDDAA